MKKYFIALVLFAVTPSIAFASWWNPLSWNWRDLFSTPVSTVMEIPVATTSPTQTNVESTTTATTTVLIVATSTQITTPVVPKKTVTKVPVPVQPTVAPTVVVTPVIVQSQPTVATTTPVAVSVAPFVITSPQANLLWNTAVNETISWSPYLGGSYFDHYEVTIGNTVANVGSQLPDTSIEVSSDQTSVTIPTSNFIAEFSAKSNIPENQINNDFYVQVNAIRFLASNTGPVASTQDVSFGFELTPTVNVTASTTILSKSSNAIVSWTSTNATSCSLSISPLPASEALLGTIATFGTLSTGTLTSPTTYTITCVNGSNSASDSVVVPI